MFRLAKSTLTVSGVRAAGSSMGSRAMSQFGTPSIPEPDNEPLLNFAPGSEEREKVLEACANLRNNPPLEIPCVVGGKEIFTGDVRKQIIPSDHSATLCTYHYGTPTVIGDAIESALIAKEKWERMPSEQRLMIFKGAADLLAGKYRYDVLAATMLGQSKTMWQAEIDAAAELIDFWRFNAKYAQEVLAVQPKINPPNTWNRLEWRPLEGFVWAVSPFNFTAIGGNLCSAPAMMGNVCVWKPSDKSMLSNWLVYQILLEAGLPEGVIQFVPADPVGMSEIVLNHPDLAALHFTGSTQVFRDLWKRVGENVHRYRSYPRIVGETGGKNFHLVHSSACVDTVVNQTIRGAFEYQGQKCSATSRMYVPESMWPELREKLTTEVAKVKMGQPDDASSFLSAVIDARSFEKLTGYINRAKEALDAEVIIGGDTDDSKGYFVPPTVIHTTNAHYETMEAELFGPVLTIHTYADSTPWSEMLRLVDRTSEYALTGAVFCRDRYALAEACESLRHSAGNFYINDKSTGSVVGQQPFGGARGSGTNDKAGHSLNLLRWTSARSIKETTVPLSSWTYPSVDM